MNRKGSRGRPKTIDRHRATEAAMETWWREGLHSTSLNELCRRIGISKPGLYREFGGEDGLVDAALQNYRALRIVPILEVLAKDIPFAEILDGVVEAITNNQGPPALCLFTQMRLTAPRLGPLAASQVRAIEKEHRDAFESAFRQALARCEGNGDLSPEFAAGYLGAQLTTALLQMSQGESAETTRALVRLALRALEARSQEVDSSLHREAEGGAQVSS